MSDTPSVKQEWTRNLLVSIAAGIATFGVQYVLYGREEAVKGAWLSLAVFLSVFVLFPVIEFIWNFLRAPRRILEDENQELEKENQKQSVVIQQLQDRLTPKLTIKEPVITPTPTQGAGPCVYIQIPVVCATDCALHNCQGHLLRVKKWVEILNRWETTSFDERLQLGWSLEGPSPGIELLPKVERRLNVFWILNSVDRFLICTPSGNEPMRAQGVFNTTDIFRFDLALTADDCPTLEILVEAKWGKRWDRPLIATAKDADVPPVVCNSN